MEAVPRVAETYTVVLLYPDYIANEFGYETYIGTVYAEFPQNAVHKIQQRAAKANIGPDDDDTDVAPVDFHPLAVFKGDCEQVAV